MMMPRLENSQNMLALVLLQNMGRDGLYRMIRTAKEKCKNVCYVSLSTPHTNLINNLRVANIEYKNFVFVDAMSNTAHEDIEPGEKCISISRPDDLEEIKRAVKHAVTRNGCTMTIFDSISTLLIYHTPDTIVRFTNDLITDDKKNAIRKMFIMLKSDGLYKEESRRLVNDLNLFADKVVKIE
ncbi:MAG: hypothetical protein V1866_00685 [archaeon]